MNPNERMQCSVETVLSVIHSDSDGVTSVGHAPTHSSQQQLVLYVASHWLPAISVTSHPKIYSRSQINNAVHFNNFLGTFLYFFDFMLLQCDILCSPFYVHMFA